MSQFLLPLILMGQPPWTPHMAFRKNPMQGSIDWHRTKSGNFKGFSESSPAVSIEEAGSWEVPHSIT